MDHISHLVGLELLIHHQPNTEMSCHPGTTVCRKPIHQLLNRRRKTTIEPRPAPAGQLLGCTHAHSLDVPADHQDLRIELPQPRLLLHYPRLVRYGMTFIDKIMEATKASSPSGPAKSVHDTSRNKNIIGPIRYLPTPLVPTRLSVLSMYSR
jgi:hypothetical protein